MSTQTPIYQVSELVAQMRKLMESSYPEIWIEGELSSVSKPASGHFYFSLKDEQSQLRCAMFRNRAAISRYTPRSGDMVRVRAKISVYTARGDLQCIVQHIEEAGEGVLQRRYEELKAKLNAAGLFAAEHKQPIPPLPRRIGLITSPSGAAIRDVLTTLARRNPGIPVTIYPAVVQGDGAAQTIIEAIRNATQHGQCDVLVITRGGGSMEDLWCFNDELLANELFNCPIPIISAVGHEVDTTIADYVADLRAPTPTAAAELLSPDQKKLQMQLRTAGQRLFQGWTRFVQQQAQLVDHRYAQLTHPARALQQQQANLQQLQRRLQRSSKEQFKFAGQRLVYLRRRLEQQSPVNAIKERNTRLSSSSKLLLRAQQQYLQSKTRAANSRAEQLDLVSPLAVLGRGFSITRATDNSIVRNSTDVSLGQALQVQLKSGKLYCEVTEIKKEQGA
jgi:exodeoxyribonuclease VII large subunit